MNVKSDILEEFLNFSTSIRVHAARGERSRSAEQSDIFAVLSTAHFERALESVREEVAFEIRTSSDGGHPSRQERDGLFEMFN